MIEGKPENLIGDRAYDSDPLDEDLRQDGIEMIAPHRSNRSKPATQDGRRLRRYARRWLVEGHIAARSRQTIDHAVPNRISGDREYNWHCMGCLKQWRNRRVPDSQNNVRRKRN